MRRGVRRQTCVRMGVGGKLVGGGCIEGILV